MTNESTYIIRGGEAGAERLRVLSKAMRPGTLALLERGGIASGMHVIDLGCGSGEVTMELARLVGSNGRIVGVDMDGSVLARARSASESGGLDIEWREGHVEELEEENAFDLVYARFLLSHLADPTDALRRMMRALRPNGRIVIEDIDITVHAYWPPSAALDRYVELYVASARARGVDPSIGPRLVAMFIDAGMTDVDISISMPVFRTGEEKSIARRTLINIADAAIAAGLTDRDEIDRLVAALVEHEANPRSLISTAQVFQVIGKGDE